MSVEWFATLMWKSSLLCAGMLVLVRSASGHSPAQRARMLLAGMGLLALLPLLSILLPPLQMNVLPAARDIQPDISVALMQAPAAVTAGSPQLAAPPPPLVTQAQLLLLLWLSGGALILARLGCGILTLHRWTRSAREVRSREWTDALRRAGAANVRLLASDRADAPLSWGVVRPTILLSSDLIDHAADADAVVAHELAHIRRGDWLALIFARVVLALYWFNPLVWLLERTLLHEAEQAADAEALRIVQPVRYAETLLRVASGRHPPIAANSIAAGRLRKRMLRVLDGGQPSAAARWSIVAAYLALGLSAPVAAIELLPVAGPMPAESLGVPRLGPPTLTLMPLVAHSPVRDEAGGFSYALAAASSVNSAPAIAPAVRDPTKYPPGYLSSAHDRRHSTEDRSQWASERAQWARERAQWSLGRVQWSKEREAWAQGRERWAQGQAQNADELARERAQWVQGRAQDVVAQASAAATRAIAAAGNVGQAVAISMQHMAENMTNGAAGMERGADGMLRGAQSMRDEAVRLRDPAYRQRKIAERAAQGERMTDQELIDSIPQLEKGADDLVKGAADMRRGAEQMRQSARNQQ